MTDFYRSKRFVKKNADWIKVLRFFQELFMIRLLASRLSKYKRSQTFEATMINFKTVKERASRLSQDRKGSIAIIQLTQWVR